MDNGFLKLMLIIGLLMVFAGGSCAPGCFMVRGGRPGGFYRRRYRPSRFSFGRSRRRFAPRRWGK